MVKKISKRRLGGGGGQGTRLINPFYWWLYFPFHTMSSHSIPLWPYVIPFHTMTITQHLWALLDSIPIFHSMLLLSRLRMWNWPFQCQNVWPTSTLPAHVRAIIILQASFPDSKPALCCFVCCKQWKAREDLGMRPIQVITSVSKLPPSFLLLFWRDCKQLARQGLKTRQGIILMTTSIASRTPPTFLWLVV